MFKIGDSLADGGFVDDGFLIDYASHQSRSTDLVDTAREALGVVKDPRDGIVGEEGTTSEARDQDVVFDVADSLLEVEGGEVVAHGETLVEGLMDSQAEGRAERGVADQEESGEGLAIHIEAEEQTELFEHVLGQEVGFVDDDQGSAALVGQEIVKGSADSGDHTRGGVRGFVAEVKQQLPIQSGDAGGGVGEIDDEVTVEVKAGGESAHGGGFARAKLAGDEAEALLADEKGEACGEFLLASGVEQVSGGDGLGKGQAGEAVELLEHLSLL